MHVDKDKDGIIDMEIKYGRIIIIYKDTPDNGEVGEIYKCNTCGKERPNAVGIKTHQAVAQRGMMQSYGLIFPYCVETFKNLETLNRHIRNKICKYTEENWKTILGDIYTTNNERYWDELA